MVLERLLCTDSSDVPGYTMLARPVIERQTTCTCRKSRQYKARLEYFVVASTYV